MKTSPAGRAAIARREGNKLKAYQDSVGVWTIGVGHTSPAGLPKVTKGLVITPQESDEILSRDLGKFEKVVNDAVKVPLTQNQFDALVSLAFNIGGGAFAKSSVVKRLNRGDIKGAADAILFWNKAGGKILQGLINRRKQEREQFLWAPTKKPTPAPAQEAEKPNVVVADGPKQGETSVVIVNTPQNEPAKVPIPTNAAGYASFGAMLVALIGGALKYFGAW